MSNGNKNESGAIKSHGHMVCCDGPSLFLKECSSSSLKLLNSNCNND